ncbi:hypothetical protein FE257_008558 [Aspergillus nanangensis]|uniref:Uncharacterized protein n=1 Tax=Aspergillus nanangensis TaxID=2582783 RepID=A0AAD4GTH1_ASPNN|nr:hypothetical protein FE257_008558 [Aspergillus nanangensis]
MHITRTTRYPTEDMETDMDKAAMQNKIRSRRSHNKSRLGCRNCKRRRVKVSNSPESGSASPSPPARVSQQLFRFKPSKYQPLSRSSPNEEEHASEVNSIGVQCNLATTYSGSGGISIPDLQLYHQYLISTYRTLVWEPEDVNQVWKIHIPCWGFKSPSVLHLILAVSALHLGHQNPELRDDYIRQADNHFTFGVRSVTAILSHLDPENCQMVYISAVLICLIYFGHGPPPGEYIVFSDSGKAEWLVYMRGVRSILHSYHERIFTGILEPAPSQDAEVMGPLNEELLRHHNRLDEAMVFIKHQIMDESRRQLYIEAATNLSSTFNEAYRTRGAGRDGISLMAPVIGWIYRLPEEFVCLLEEKDSFALIILAHWSILLRYMGTCWLMDAWDRHVISGIRLSLHEDFHQWIEWPWVVIHE